MDGRPRQSCHKQSSTDHLAVQLPIRRQEILPLCQPRSWSTLNSTTALASTVVGGSSSAPGRDGDAALARFRCIARGSASELEYQLPLARDLKLIRPSDHEQLEQQTMEIMRMLTVFVQRLTAES